MKIAVDARMLGSGGIGTYIASLLPYFSSTSSRTSPTMFLGSVQKKRNT